MQLAQKETIKDGIRQILLDLSQSNALSQVSLIEEKIDSEGLKEKIGNNIKSALGMIMNLIESTLDE